MMPSIFRQSRAAACLLAALMAGCAEIPTDLSEVPLVLAPPAGHTFTGAIRLGLVPAADELEVGGTDAFVIRDGVTGETVMSGSNEMALVTYVNENIPGKTSWRLLVRTCVTPEERDAYVALAAQKDAESSLDFVTYAKENGDCWNVYLGDLGLSTSSGTRLHFRSVASSNQLATNSDLYHKVTTVSSIRGFRIAKGNTTVTTPNFVAVQPSAGRTKVEEREVDGTVEVFLNPAGSLTAVNAVGLEQYLRRVVPLVLPPDAYGNAEAQKAHAVAERTRALYNLGRHAAEGFDYYPGEYQPYGEAADEHEASNAAIEATAGLVARFDGQLIDTPYHQSSGGWTANSEDVFEPVIPYLRGISESQLPWGIEKKITYEFFARSGATDLRGVLDSERGVWSRFTYWKVDWTRAELAEALSASFGFPVGDVTAVRTVERGAYGRVRLIEFDTDVGTLVAEKNDIRSKLRYPTAEGDWELLSSTLFFIAALESEGEVTGWRAYGAGLGHGVGMSQIGAVMMADQGKSFETILTTYYTGVTIEPRE